MADTAAFLVEAAGPLSVLIAQVVQAGKPFLPRQDEIPALTRLMEDPDESREFAAYLRGDKTR